MKKYIIFLVGCFVIGFVSAMFGINMSKNITDFLTVIAIDLLWALLLFRKQVFKLNSENKPKTK